MPSVSIALATYNGARFILDQLESYSKQTRLPNELVVSDDGSSDRTLEIVAKFAERAPFAVKILPSGPRLGYSNNFFRAATECTSDLIMFSDQDDVWMPTKVERQLRSMTPPVLLSLHCLDLVGNNLKPYGRIDQGITRTRTVVPLEIDPYPGSGGWGNTMMFRRELLAMVPPAARPDHPDKIHTKLDHDLWIYTLAAAMGHLAHIYEPLILYRQHGGNVSGTKPRTFRQKMAGAISVPLDRYYGRAALYASMISILRKLEKSEVITVRERAAKARERFAQRLSTARSRILLHESDKFLTRLRWFVNAYPGCVFEPGQLPGLLLSILKDLTLGVALHRASTNHILPDHHT